MITDMLQTCTTGPTLSVLTLLVESTNSSPLPPAHTPTSRKTHSHVPSLFDSSPLSQQWFNPTRTSGSPMSATARTKSAHTLSTKAKVGIGVSVGIVVFVAACLGMLSIIYVRRKRKERERTATSRLQPILSTDEPIIEGREFHSGQVTISGDASLPGEKVNRETDEVNEEDNDEIFVYESRVEVVFEDEITGNEDSDEDGDDEREDEVETELDTRGRTRRKA